MLNNILVYVNLCMFIYNLYKYYIVYMNSITILSRLKVRPVHICYEQAKLFSYSLLLTYEQPNIHIIHK